MKGINLRKFLLKTDKPVAIEESIPNKKTENAIKDADHIWSDCKLKKLRKRKRRIFK